MVVVCVVCINYGGGVYDGVGGDSGGRGVSGGCFDGDICTSEIFNGKENYNIPAIILCISVLLPTIALLSLSR